MLRRNVVIVGCIGYWLVQYTHPLPHYFVNSPTWLSLHLYCTMMRCSCGIRRLCSVIDVGDDEVWHITTDLAQCWAWVVDIAWWLWVGYVTMFPALFYICWHMLCVLDDTSDAVESATMIMWCVVSNDRLGMWYTATWTHYDTSLRCFHVYYSFIVKDYRHFTKFTKGNQDTFWIQAPLLFLIHCKYACTHCWWQFTLIDLLINLD